MTVVFSVPCADGVVVASDTQVTGSYRGMSFPAQKLHDMGDEEVAITCPKVGRRSTWPDHPRGG